MTVNLFESVTHESMVVLAILSCGLYTDYTDFHYGKIANVYTLFLIGFGVISQALFVIEGQMDIVYR